MKEKVKMQSVSTNPGPKKNFAIALACITWLSIALQYFIATGSTLNFFSYFTVQSNLLIAISLTFSSIGPNSKSGIFFSRLSVQSAIALYIFIVALVYNLILRGLFSWTGWPWLADNLLHVVVPVLYILYWLYFKTSGRLKWQDGIYWMIYPLIYLVYSLVRGSMVQWYPYPFLHAGNLGYPTVLINIAMVIAVFLVAALVVIFITRSRR